MMTSVAPTCPICLGLFNLPRQLPCAHSFCHSCLQSYITSKAAEHDKKRYIECPLCSQPTGHFKQNQPTSEWASLFPVDTVLQSTLPTKSKGDRLCDACSSEGVYVTATGVCGVCREAMCNNCLSVHKKQKMTKSHTILSNEDIENNMQHVMKFAEGFTCFEHENEDLKFYCDNHKIACCGFCYFKNHKSCLNVRMLKEDNLPAMLRETKTNEIIEELTKLEAHLKSFIDMKESNMNELESQVNGLADQIREMRKKVNTAFDELEIKVMTEGRRLHKEFAIKTQEENHQCLSLIHAIRNSRLLCETVVKYGLDIQKFLTEEKIKSQLPLYYSQVRSKCERTDTLTLHLKFTPLLDSLFSISSSDVGKLVTLTGSNLPMGKAIKEVENSETLDVVISGIRPCFTGIAVLPRDRVVLVDNRNDQCILLSSSRVVGTYKLTETPYDICMLWDEEVAVPALNQTKIQILSVRDDVISPVRTITTKYKCMGIAAAHKSEMLVVGDCGSNKYCCILVRDGVEVSHSDQYDSTSGYIRYVALNNSKTRVYVTVCHENSLHCFNMEGEMQFTYSPGNLLFPLGVAVDRDDNIYVVGRDSHNIHQLSPEGYNLQVITKGLPQFPMAISFDNSRDTFMITNESNAENQKVHIYQLKKKLITTNHPA